VDIGGYVARCPVRPVVDVARRGDIYGACCLEPDAFTFNKLICVPTGRIKASSTVNIPIRPFISLTPPRLVNFQHPRHGVEAKGRAARVVGGEGEPAIRVLAEKPAAVVGGGVEVAGAGVGVVDGRVGQVEEDFAFVGAWRGDVA